MNWAQPLVKNPIYTQAPLRMIEYVDDSSMYEHSAYTINASDIYTSDSIYAYSRIYRELVACEHSKGAVAIR